MVFKLVHAKYDRETERAYVELRDEDDETAAMFWWWRSSRIARRQG